MAWPVGPGHRAPFSGEAVLRGCDYTACVGRFAAARTLRRRARLQTAATDVAGPRRGTVLAAGYAAIALALAVWWAHRRGFAVELSPLELGGLVVLSACAGRISVLIGPRTWYSPSTPVMIFAGVVGGPLAGALAGAATEGLTTDRVWRHRLFGAARSSTEGFVAGLAGLLPGLGLRSDVTRLSVALAGAVLLAQGARLLVISARGIRPVGHALRVGALTDALEAAVALPLLAVFVDARRGSPLVVELAIATIVLGLALAERAHARQAEQLERERTAARTDALTGASNRLAFEEALAHEHARIVRGARPAGLFLVDLDRFKLVNDLHGHDIGDRLLVDAVDRLRHGLRGMDLVARWGGDELIVLAPDIPNVEALERFGERLRTLVSEVPFRLGVGGDIDATTSVGGTLLDGGTTPALALKRADVAVYRAKEHRNASVVEIPAELRPAFAAVASAVLERR